MDISLETGTNLTNLGFTYLILKFILPYVVGFVLLAIAALLAFAIYRRLQGTGLSRQEILLSLVGAGLILILFVVR